MDKKQRILNAAYESFQTQGYKGTTMDTVAKIALVGKGTIYTFFSNKNELFEEIVQQELNNLLEKANATYDKNEPLQDNISRFLETILEDRNNHQFLIKLIREQHTTQSFEVISMVQRIESAILDEIQRIIKENASPSVNAELLAFVIYGLYILLVSKWEEQRAPLSKDQIKAVITHQIQGALMQE